MVQDMIGQRVQHSQMDVVRQVFFGRVLIVKNIESVQLDGFWYGGRYFKEPDSLYICNPTVDGWISRRTEHSIPTHLPCSAPYICDFHPFGDWDRWIQEVPELHSGKKMLRVESKHEEVTF